MDRINKALDITKLDLLTEQVDLNSGNSKN